MDVRLVELKTIREFVEQNHYSHSVNGLKISECFGLFVENTLKGALIFGELSTTAWKKYSDNEKDVLELRRMVISDEMPKNTGSQFLSKAIKIIKNTTAYKIIVSYADPHHSHCGIIYQASNWSYHGTTNPDVLLKTPDGKLYHSRAMRTKYKGELKPFARRLQELDSRGLLCKVTVPGKHIYTYKLVGKQRVGNTKNYPKPNL